MICRYYLTYSCNCQCEFCKSWLEEELDEEDISSLGVIAGNLRSLRDMGVKKVIFTGGEPLMHPDVVAVLKTSKELGLSSTLYTDGLLFPSKAKEIVGYLDELFVSIDAPGADEHNRVRGQECFDEAIDSLHAAHNLGLKPIINFTVTRDSIINLPEMEELAEKHNAFLNVNIVHDYFGISGFEKNSIGYLRRFISKKSTFVDLAELDIVSRGGNDIKRPVCKASDAVITISPDNKLLLPCSNIKASSVPINGNLKGLLSSDIVKGYKGLQGRMDKCKGCTDFDYISPSIYTGMNRYTYHSLISKLERSLKEGKIKLPWTPYRH